jgi:hypothetical protein
VVSATTLEVDKRDRKTSYRVWSTYMYCTYRYFVITNLMKDRIYRISEFCFRKKLSIGHLKDPPAVDGGEGMEGSRDCLNIPGEWLGRAVFFVHSKEKPCAHDDVLARASLCVLYSSLRDQIVKNIISSSSRIEYSSPYSLTHSTYDHEDVLARASLCVLHSSLRDQIVKRIIPSSSRIEYSSPYSLTHSTYNHDDVLAPASVCVSCTALCVTRLLRRSYPPPPA